MLKFYTGGEQETDDDMIAINMHSQEDAVSPEYAMESMIDSLLGVASFLHNNSDLYRGALVDFSIELPEGHDADNYTDVPEIFKNMEHQKLVDFYRTYCGEDCFETSGSDEGIIWYSFIIETPSNPVDESAIWEYYNEHVL